MVQLLYIIASIHTLLCPFTKVEESFNIQATHDILYHRHNLSQYDHNEFPGVVPRTFIGPLVISLLSAPTALFFNAGGLHKFWMQYVVRLGLALSVIGAWNHLKNTLQKLYGNTFTWWFTLITVTQYHFMFYMSRPLPNMMAMPLVLIAYEGWLARKHKQFLISAGAAIIIFRAELAMLFGLFLIIDLYFKKIEVIRLLKIVIPAGIGLIGLTVTVDSMFWGRLLWPEAEVLWYNTILNKSSDWGTSPFLWYLYSALPRGLGPSLVLIPIGLYLDRRMIQVAAPAFVFILLYSILPHKELRFIIYVFPLLNMASAACCSYIYIRRTKAPIYELLFWGQIFIVIGNIIMTLAFVSVAMTNYPGGLAMSRFHKLLKNEPYVHVHISNLAAQTGVTRFAQINNHWRYSKNESLSQEQLQEYTHLLIEAKSKYSLSVKAFVNTHDVLDIIESFSHITLTYKMIPPIKIKTRPSIFILQRKNFREYPHGKIAPVIEKVRDEMYADTLVNEEEESEELNTEPVEETVIKLVNYYDEEVVSSDDVTVAESDEKVDEMTQVIEEPVENEVPLVETVVMTQEPKIKENIEENENQVDQENIEISPKIKAKRALDELKSFRQERKKKAIEKIKTETRKEVVASAKEKLRDIMKRHKHIAKELAVSISDEEKEVDGRGDIPESIAQVDNVDEEIQTEINETEAVEDIIQVNELTSRTNENIDSIVEEVIVRLIDRKMYDDKTKPEDIRAEDRQLIQKIVEEVLSERMNFNNTEFK